MEKEFVSYEQAVALEELGFDEECLAHYDYYGKSPFPLVINGNCECCDNSGAQAPLKQQALNFFRKKYNYFGLIEGGYDNGKNLFTYVIWRKSFDDCIDEYWDTFEQTENACIDKLIELAKHQNNGKSIV